MSLQPVVERWLRMRAYLTFFLRHLSFARQKKRVELFLVSSVKKAINSNISTNKAKHLIQEVLLLVTSYAKYREFVLLRSAESVPGTAT